MLTLVRLISACDLFERRLIFEVLHEARLKDNLSEPVTKQFRREKLILNILFSTRSRGVSAESKIGFLIEEHVFVLTKNICFLIPHMNMYFL